MNRSFVFAGALALALAVVVAGSAVQAEDKDDKSPTIKKIMKDAHGFKAGLKTKITKNLKDEKWNDIQSEAKDWVKLAEAMGKIKPPIGTAASWKKLTATYSKDVKSLESGAKKKDEEAVKDALGKIGESCADCHKAHKPKDPDD